MCRFALLSSSLIALLTLGGCAANADDHGDDGHDDVRGAEAAATGNDAATTTTTTLTTDDGSVSRGLTMTFSFADAGTPVLTLSREARAARLTCTSMSASASVGANDSFVAASCVDLTQPGYEPGFNRCEMHFNIFQNRQTAPSVKFDCKHPAALTAPQVKLLDLVYGAPSAYQRVPDRTFSSSRGEVGGGELSATVRGTATATKPENDPIAFVAHTLEAARPLLNKTGSLAFASPAGSASQRSGAIALITVFPDPRQMVVPINARTVDGKLLISRDTSLLAPAPSSGSWAIATKQELTSRLIHSIDAR